MIGKMARGVDRHRDLDRKVRLVGCLVTKDLLERKRLIKKMIKRQKEMVMYNYVLLLFYLDQKVATWVFYILIIRGLEG